MVGDEKLQKIIEGVGKLVAAVESNAYTLWQKKGLTLGQLRALLVVFRTGKITVNGLASALGISASAATGLTDRLVQHGLIERGYTPEDRRVVELKLTSEGQEIARELIGVKRSLVLSALKKLSTDEIETLSQLLERIALIVEQESANVKPDAGNLEHSIAVGGGDLE
jgi:DNA-binding MarR family transcriptional regulator